MAALRTTRSLARLVRKHQSVVQSRSLSLPYTQTGSQVYSLRKQNSTLQRHFTTSRINQVESSTTVKDPDHPSGLYYHQLPGSDRYTISFLSKPPSSPQSASIIAFVNCPASSQQAVYDLALQNPDSVEANPAFLELMHDTLKNECVPQDGLLEYEAMLRKDGWAHLNDQRHPLMPGRIATPENIIASVAFTDETLRPESYEANDVYRLVTREEGFMDLRPNWLMFIKNRCEQVN